MTTDNEEEEARQFFDELRERLTVEPPIFSHVNVGVNPDWAAWYMTTTEGSGHDIMAVATLKLMMARVGIEELIKQLYAEHEADVLALVKQNPDVWWILNLLDKPKPPTLWQKIKRFFGAK